MTKPRYLRPPIGGISVGDFSLHDFVSKWMMQQDDIAETGVFAAANTALSQDEDQRPRTVTFGDSITALWDLTPYDSSTRRFINRGISGQNSSQMLLRFMDDVVALTPVTVVILCGTNDLRCYVGDPASIVKSAGLLIRRNLTAMCDIAKANGIKVVLSTLPPIGADFDSLNRDAAGILAINAWISGLAMYRGYPLADYHQVLVDARGHLPVELGEDGLHPSPTGYARMWPVLEQALMKLLP